MNVSAARLVFVDVEVAGAEISRPIIQVAAIAVASDLEELETFEAKLKFDQRLADPHSLPKNRYCEKTWAAEARSATRVAPAFAQFLRRHAAVDGAGKRGSYYQVAQLVAHNASFDGPFLQAWFERIGKFFPGHYRMLCTVQRALWLFHEHHHLRPPTDYKLGTLCDYFGVRLNPKEAHTALADVRATVELYRRMTLLATAESANRTCRESLGAGQSRRVARVAARGEQACRSRRKRVSQTCRSRRRRFRTASP
jgi:hypothetical protein